MNDQSLTGDIAPEPETAAATHFLLDWHGQIIVKAHGAFRQLRLHELVGQDMPGRAAASRYQPCLEIEEPPTEAAPQPWSGAGALAHRFGASTSGCRFASVAARSGTAIALRGEQGFLASLPDRRGVEWDRPEAHNWEVFLPLDAEDLADLVFFASHAWRMAASGRVLSGPSIDLANGFLLRAGPLFRLITPGRFLPAVAQIGHHAEIRFASVIFPRDATRIETLSLADDGPHAPASPIPVRPRPELPSLVETMSEFLDGAQARLTLGEGGISRFPRPVFAQDLSNDCFTHNFVFGVRPPLLRTERNIIRRERERFVSLARQTEGSVFDDDGVSRNLGYLQACYPTADPFFKQADDLFLSLDQLNRVERLDARCLIFTNGNMQNYYHWLVEAMLSLFILDRALPADFAILLPPSVSALAGSVPFSTINFLNSKSREIITASHELHVVADAAWLDENPIEKISVSSVQAFRAHFANITGATPRGRHIYIVRNFLRYPGNKQEVDDLLARYAFEQVVLEDMTFIDQVRCFQEAELIVATHGAGLSNLLFCASGCSVIELMPEQEFRPFFWQIACKLDLDYSYISCPTNDGLFDGMLRVDIGVLTDLLDRALEDNHGIVDGSTRWRDRVTAVGGVAAERNDDLRVFANRYGLDSNHLINQGSGQIDIVIDRAGLPGFDGDIHVMRVEPYGNFGNAFYALLNALLVGQRLGITRYEVQEPSAGASVLPLHIGGVLFSRNQRGPALWPTLAGQFFEPSGFESLVGDYPTAELITLIDTFLKPRHANLLSRVRRLGEDVVALNFRGGDVFDPVGAQHHGYVQPPASYYVASFEFVQRHFGVTAAHLVYQDRTNPAVDVVEAALAQRGVPMTQQSARPEEDLATLLSARHIVAPYGTFCEAAALLAHSLATYTSFRRIETQQSIKHWAQSRVGNVLRARNTRTFVVDDPARDFTAPNAWRRTDEQLDLIARYPKNYLRLMEEIGTGTLRGPSPP